MGKQLDKDAEIVTIEIHGEEAKLTEKNIRKAEVLPEVKVITGNALQVIPKLKDTFDFVFIDAEKTEYRDYLRLIEDKLHKGSVIVADNAGIFARQMKDFLEYTRTSGKYRSKYVAVGADGLEISIKL